MDDIRIMDSLNPHEKGFDDVIVCAPVDLTFLIPNVAAECLAFDELHLDEEPNDLLLLDGVVAVEAIGSCQTVKAASVFLILST
jgi:hypothetical protein